MLRSLILLFSTLLVAQAGPARAQAPLTVDEAIALALARNPDIRAAAASEEVSAARVGQARAGYLPRVDLVEGWQRSDHPVFVFSTLLSQRRFTAADFALDRLNNPDPLSNHRIAVMLEQALFDGWRTRSAVRSARLDLESSRLDTRKTQDALRLSVITAYGRVLAAQSLTVSAIAAVKTAEEDLRRAADRRDAGLETEASVLAFRVHQSEAEARRVRAIADERVARATLASLIGDTLDAQRPLAPLSPGPAGGQDDAALEAEAMKSRADVRQAALRVEQADSARALARAGLWPQLVAQGGAEANGSSFGGRESSWTAAVQVRWNIFAGGADAARVREAAAARRQAEAARDRVETAVRLEVRTAIAEHVSAVAREASSRQMVEQARESQRIIRDRYDAGLAPASEVLRAASLLAQSEAAVVAASIDVHVTAAALDKAIGRSGSQ